ncbi:hypothetical protein RHGRI_011072 [Rhododendron griersonianum]|uniref:Uncharacterized protein n=1 Tax=Rhododendron griersonianum TaxID=479676 RepID=A0AAV6KLJ7_9ERIC|nr:hypothetical protein RHGRI_011072 [Rhododendron griersonianum]
MNIMTTSSLDQSTDMDCDVNVCTAGGSDKMSKRLTHAVTRNDGHSKERGKRLSHADSDSVRRSKQLATRNVISTSSLDQSTNRDCDVNVCTAGGPDKMSNRSTHAEIENGGHCEERSKRFSHGDSDGDGDGDGDCEERSNRSSHGESESESDGDLDSGPIKRTLVGLQNVYKGVKPDIGRMWWDTLYAAFTNNHPTTSLPLGILLTRFMYGRKVPILAGDKLADKKTTHIGRGTIGKSESQSKIHRTVNNPVSLEGIHDMILTIQENQIEFYQMLKKVVRTMCRDDDPSDADTLDDE